VIEKRWQSPIIGRKKAAASYAAASVDVTTGANVVVGLQDMVKYPLSTELGKPTRLNSTV
jgi:hypothetical protein